MWVEVAHSAEFAALHPLGTKTSKASRADSRATESVFNVFTTGVKTNEDEYVYDFVAEPLEVRAVNMVECFNSELDRWNRSGRPAELDGWLQVDETVLKWIRNTKRTLRRGRHIAFDIDEVRTSLYRPFTKKYLYFEKAFSEDQYRCRCIFPSPDIANENRVICCTNHSQAVFCVQISDTIVNEAVGGRSGQCFPFYTYDEDGANRRENITDWALEQFQTHYKNKKITKWDIFHYVYGVLHQPTYREKFADNLKLELPRIPFLDDFRKVAEAGRTLAELHVGYEDVEPWPLRWVVDKATPIDFRVEKMRLSKDRTTLVVNPTLALADIPPEVFAYRLGNRSALDWVIDQYQVSTDKRSGITSDDDPEYIVRLVEKVVRVSVATAAIVATL
jgi:predicted helicase